MTVQYRPGAYCDVAPWFHGGLLNMVVDGARVNCYLEDALIWSQVCGHEDLLFGRCAVQGNQFLTIHKGQRTGDAWLVGNGLVRDLGMTFGVQPVGIDAHEAYVVFGKGVYERHGLVSQTYPFPPGVPPDSSQGLSDVQPDGTLWWADVHRTMVIGGVTFTYPNQRRSPDSELVTVGQVDPPGIAAAVSWPGSDGPKVKITRVIEGDAFEPHVAVSPTGRVAICARTPRGAAYMATTITELSA